MMNINEATATCRQWLYRLDPTHKEAWVPPRRHPARSVGLYRSAKVMDCPHAQLTKDGLHCRQCGTCQPGHWHLGREIIPVEREG